MFYSDKAIDEEKETTTKKKVRFCHFLALCNSPDQKTRDVEDSLSEPANFILF